jgi:hypothetical protein
VKRFLTHDGLWLPENNTNLKASIAAVVDSILDLKAKQMGLFTILDEEFRQRLTTSNLNVYFPGYDALKRYETLAKTKFSVLIEFDGEKWASKQDFEDLEKRMETRTEFFSENIHLTDQRVGFNKAIYNLLSGGDLWTAKLHANHLFRSREELKEYLTNHFKINGITNKNQLDIILKNGFGTGFFSEEEMTLYQLNVRKNKELQFVKSLPFLDCMSISKRQQTKVTDTVNQKLEIIRYDDIIPIISKELEYFEKAFINRLAKIREKFEVVSLSDMLHPTATPQLPVVRSSLLELISIFHEVLSTYTYRSIIVWPIKIKDKDILNKVYSILFAKIAHIRVMVSQTLEFFYGGEFNKIFEDYAAISIYRTKSLLNHVKVFKNSDMGKESKELTDAFWNIHKECVQQAFPEAQIYSWNFDYNNDGWEKFLQLQTMYPDQTLENYIKGNSKS